MTREQRLSIVHTFKTLSTMLGFIMLVGGLAVAAVLKFSDIQSAQESKDQHRQIREEYKAADALIIEHAREVESQLKDVGRDVRTIKCLILAPNAKQKQKCGLE